MRFDIAKMAILTENSYEDMIKMIDFFMSDRAADADLTLTELDIDESKRLKCSADYKATASRNADAKFEFSGAVRRTSAPCAGAKKSLKSDGGIYGGTPTYI